MIINTGTKTDIPSFFSEWFYHRIDEGFVYARSPYVPHRVTKFTLSSDVVDCIAFCTKNPRPMLSKLYKLESFGQFWFVTITPYGQEIEPYVPPFTHVITAFQELSKQIGAEKVVWRYDPIFINHIYTLKRHIESFELMASFLAGYTHSCVISFIDLYEKHAKNSLPIEPVKNEDRFIIAEAFSQIAQKYDMRLKTCLEGQELSIYGVDCSGCMTQPVIERAIGKSLSIPQKSPSRKGCQCLLENDIGAYNSCAHGCIYCYANSSLSQVKRNVSYHNPNSPLLIGELLPHDVIHEAKQKSFRTKQHSLF